MFFNQSTFVFSLLDRFTQGDEDFKRVDEAYLTSQRGSAGDAKRGSDFTEH